MNYEQFNPEDILEALKAVGKFTLTNLNQDIKVANSEGDIIVPVKPNGFDISLFVKFVDSIVILNGGICNKRSDVASSMSIDIYDYSEVFNFFRVVIGNLPIYSPESFLRVIKPSLIEEFPLFVDNHLQLKKSDVKFRLKANEEKKIYKEKKPDILDDYSDLIVKLNQLSTDIYNIDLIVENEINFTAQNKIEIFYDSIGSEIIQYSDEIVITVDFEFLNANQVLVESVIVERFNSKRKVPDDFNEIIMEKVLKEIELNYFYEELKSGTYKILLQPDASNVFFHEAFAAHLLSGTYISEKISTIFTNRIGEKFHKLEGIDIIMDPTLEHGYGSYKYDHQGVKAQAVVLMENGVIKDLLNDKKSTTLLEIIEKDKLLVEHLSSLENIDELISEFVPEKHQKRIFKQIKDRLAHLLDKDLLTELINNVPNLDKNLDWRSDYSRLTAKSNGHSRVQWWTGINKNGELIPISSEARMSNLIIKNNNPDDGVKIEDFAIESCKKDNLEFYLSINALSGEIDVQNGTFIIEPSTVKKIYVDGREEEIVNPGTLSMSLEDFLKSIEKIGHENEVSYGQCGASSGFVPVGSYTPKIFVGYVPYQAAPELKAVDDVIIDILNAKDL